MSSLPDPLLVMTKWHSRVARPYSIAYNEAYRAYIDARKKDEDAAKARAEMFVGIAGIMSTSILIAAMVTVPLHRIAARLALRTLGSQNTRMVTNLYTRGAAHPVTSFVFGKAYDLLKDKAGGKVKDIAVQMVQNVSSGVSAVDPYSRGEQMKGIVEEFALGISAISTAISADRDKTVSQREQQLQELRESPFMNPPEKKVKSEKLIPVVELGFYMQHLLQSDYLMLHMPIGSRTPPSRAGGIDAMPLSKNYPTSQTPSGVRSYRTVHSARPGDAIQDALDKAHKAVFGQPFYDRSWLPDVLRGDAGRAAELVRAQQTLIKLSRLTRPTRADEVRLFSF